MTDVNQLVTQHLNIWTSATQKKSSAGRGNGGGVSLYGLTKLRALILGLAVRGKLVPQFTKEGTGDDLKDDVFRARSAAIRSKRTRKQKALPEISVEEVPFEVPASWAIIRLGDLTNYGITDKAESRDMDGDTWVLEMEDVEKASSRLLQRVYFSNRRFKSSKNRFVAGDVIYGKLRPYLDKVLIADEDGVCTTEMIPMRAYGETSSDYLRIFLKSPEFIRYADDSTHGMNLPRLGTEKARLAVVPLPPLAEQHRIVAKVDALMGLCDALEAQSEDSLKAHQILVETCLATLTNSETPEELTHNWGRLETHFDTLFSTEESIKSLQEAVLEWAILGLLSKRVHSDTSPKKSLIQNNQARKERYSETNDARLKKCADILIDEYKANLPKYWSLASFDELFLFIDYRGRTPKKTEDGTPLITAKNVRMGVLNREPREFVSNETYVDWMTRGFPKVGDLFFTTEAPLANICINDIEEPFAIAQRVICFQPISKLNTKFLEIAIRSRPVQGMIDRNGTGMTAKGIKASKLKPLPLPFPPPEEQERIVSKVEELLDICQLLLTNIPNANGIAVTLADTLTSKIH